jgi:hypothetical protein
LLTTVSLIDSPWLPLETTATRYTKRSPFIKRGFND